MSNYIGHFSVWGDFDVDQITLALGLQPSATYSKGELWEGADSPAKVSTWDLHCPVDLPVSEQVSFLVDLLSPTAAKLRPLAERYTAELNVSASKGEVLSLKSKALQRIASLGVNINCFCWEDEAEDAN